MSTQIEQLKAVIRELIKKLVREELSETAKRDYKAEYKKYGSSTKAKKYRAELNQYNRKKGTYGNGDGKDASHKGGKIVGFEKESTNRGRAEKSRLKKESVNEKKNPKREKVKKDFKTSLKFAKGVIRKIDTFMKSDDWGVVDGFVTNKQTGLASIVKDMEKSMNQIIKMPVDESVNEKVIKVSKKDDVPGNPMKMKGEEKINKLAWSGSVGMKKPGSYEIKGNKLNVNNIRPRDKGFFVRHFTMGTGFRKANLYYDGVHWQGKKKF